MLRLEVKTLLALQYEAQALQVGAGSAVLRASCSQIPCATLPHPLCHTLTPPVLHSRTPCITLPCHVHLTLTQAEVVKLKRQLEVQDAEAECGQQATQVCALH